MAVTYSISRHEFPLQAATTHETRKRCDAAAYILYSAAYEMLRANALLDRPVAWRIMHEIAAAEVSPPPIGHLRQQRFVLRPDDSQSPFVGLYITRD